MKIDDFDRWLEELVYPRDVEDFIQVIYDGGQGDNDGYEMKKTVSFFTDNYKYQITAIERDPGNSYLGCQVSTRKPRAGEDWTRGNDLPDGELNRETLEQIKNRIIANELESLSVKTPQKSPEEN
jgi:hypothetical protein